VKEIDRIPQQFADSFLRESFSKIRHLMAQRAMNAELVKKRLTDCNIPKLMSKAKERIREKKK